jgi:choline monooxygenase
VNNSRYNTLDSSLNPIQYSSTRLPLESASTLPPHCYTSEVFFAREKETIFDQCWHFVGRRSEFNTPGAYKSIDTIAGSALVICSESGSPKAYINSCSHRGTRLKNHGGHCRQIICPYHSWVFDLDGHLKRAHGMHGVKNFDKDNYNLTPVRLEEYGGFVFINFSSGAICLETWIGDLPRQMASHTPEKLQKVQWNASFRVNANWKFLIENALEAYHTGTVHKESLGSQDSEAIQSQGNWDALFVPNEGDKSIGTLPGETQQMPFLPNLSSRGRTGTWFTVVYPCTQIVFSQDCVWWLDIKPLSVSQSQVEMSALFPKDAISHPDFTQHVQAYYDRWETATKEDNVIAEAQQNGNSAGSDRAGRYSLREHCVHKLNNWVLEQVF